MRVRGSLGTRREVEGGGGDMTELSGETAPGMWRCGEFGFRKMGGKVQAAR